MCVLCSVQNSRCLDNVDSLARLVDCLVCVHFWQWLLAWVKVWLQFTFMACSVLHS